MHLNWGTLHLVEDRRSSKQNVLIYGAGLSGLQLPASLRQNRTFHVIAFVDDKQNFQV